jgi:hypothetical protein
LPQGPLWRKHGTRSRAAKIGKIRLATFLDRSICHSGPIGSMLLERRLLCVQRPKPHPNQPSSGRVERTRRAIAEWAVQVLPRLVYSRSPDLYSNCPGMNDDQDQRGGPAGSASRDSRQERLKLALRENLKRRKSQARGRSDAPPLSSENADAALDDARGKKPRA